MSISHKQLALIHVARRKLDLSEETYRTALAKVAGVGSATELDQQGFEALMGLFAYLGFDPVRPGGKDFGPREGMASFAQCELIRALWHEYTRQMYEGEDELNKWLFRSQKVSLLRFLTSAKARKVITALKAMKSRAA